MRLPLLIAVSLMLSTPAHAAWKTISSEKELNAKVVGKSFIDPASKGWFRLKKNGSLTGGFEGKKLTGNWDWQGKYVCYNRKLGSKKLPGDCIVIRVNGNKITTTRKKGKGRTTEYEPK